MDFHDPALRWDVHPVLLVHGRGMGSDSLSGIARRLEETGYPEAYVRSIDLDPSDGPNAAAAEYQIAPFVESWLQEITQCFRLQQRAAAPPTRIDIVAHSMGGVSTRWYASQLRPDRVNTWLSLVGPNHGSSPDCPGAADSGKRDLCPPFARTMRESKVQFTLNGGPGPDVDETPFGIGADRERVRRIAPDAKRRIAYVTLRISRDAWIVPAASTIIDGAGGICIDAALRDQFIEDPPGNFLANFALDHDELLDDPRVHEFILQVLGERVRPAIGSSEQQ